MKFTGRTAKRLVPYPRDAYSSKLGRPPVVVFGVSKNGAFKGACFAGEKLLLAGLAAVLLKFDVFEALSNEMHELAKELPTGHVYADGSAFLPNIPKGLYRRLYVASGGLVRDGSSGPQSEALAATRRVPSAYSIDQPLTIAVEMPNCERLVIDQIFVRTFG